MRDVAVAALGLWVTPISRSNDGGRGRLGECPVECATSGTSSGHSAMASAVSLTRLRPTATPRTTSASRCASSHWSRTGESCRLSASVAFVRRAKPYRFSDGVFAVDGGTCPFSRM